MGFTIYSSGPSRILHDNLTAHSTAGWTRRQFGDAVPEDLRSAVGPGFEGRRRAPAVATVKRCWRELSRGSRVRARAVFGGLYPEYELERIAK